jgi:hypothetical protein
MSDEEIGTLVLLVSGGIFVYYTAWVLVIVSLPIVYVPEYVIISPIVLIR